MRRAAWLVASSLVAAGCGPEPGPGPAWEVPVGVYAEFLSDAEVEAALPDLAEQGATITRAVPSRRIGDEGLAELLRAAEAEGVAMRLWLVLEEDAGYWLNEANLELFAAEATRLLGWLDDEALAAEALVFDMEPALAYTEEIRALDPHDLAGAAELMSTHLDREGFERSRQLLGETVREVQAHGLAAVCVTYPQVLDDLVDGDEDMQDALDIPVLGVPFDEVALMIYQTTFADSVGEWIGPDLVDSYARDAAAELGDRAVVALGIVGRVGMFEEREFPYEGPGDLAADIVTAEAAGAARVEVYSLDGMLLEGGPTRWLTGRPPDDDPPDGSVLTDIVRAVVTTVDGMLDAP